MEVITKKQALSEGLKKYYTGKPCKNGHLSERSVKYGVCAGCQSMRMKELNDKKKKPYSEVKKRWYKINRERILARQKASYESNKRTKKCTTHK